MPDGSVNPLPLSVHGKSAYTVARYAASEAGKILKKYYGKPVETQVKGKRDLVTEADLLSEEKILEIINTEFPSHGILSEEAGASREGAEYTWIIDPLDGTNNFYFGIPLFCVNIALVRRGEVVLGVTYDPMRNETFYCVKGKGAHLNGKKIRVSDVKTLDKASAGVDLGYNVERSKDLLDMATGLWPKLHCLRLTGSSALGLAYVACGRFSLYFHKYLFPWDVASGLLLIREAGGEVTRYDGKQADTADAAIIASNPALRIEFLNWLNRR
jgi:myo-inositol-1(or 4)-monophosphatase